LGATGACLDAGGSVLACQTASYATRRSEAGTNGANLTSEAESRAGARLTAPLLRSPPGLSGYLPPPTVGFGLHPRRAVVSAAHDLPTLG